MNLPAQDKANETFNTTGEKSPNISSNVSIANDNEIYCCWQTRYKRKKTKKTEKTPKSK